MSDSIDRVFVKAITTIRTLSTRSSHNSLPRPPLANRVKLYGLYKQATEGDVGGLMDRPIGTRPEDEAAKRKWDAWKMEEGLSKTDAKIRYISYLIETMKSHTNDSIEARELLSDLEYLWDQVRDQQSPGLLSVNDRRLGVTMPDSGYVNAGSLIGRTESPALSLYRLASSGSNTNLIRPVSRLSMTNIQQYSQGGNLGITDRAGNQSNVDKQRTISSNTVVSAGISASSSTSNVADSGVSGQTASGTVSNGIPKSMEFIKWQNDINSTLNRLTFEISNLRSIGYQQQLQSGNISATATTQQNSAVRRLGSTAGPKRPGKPDQSLIIATLSNIKQLLSNLVFRVYKFVKMFIKHAAVDSVVLLVCLAILKKLSIIKSTNSATSSSDSAGVVKVSDTLGGKLIETGEYVANFLRLLYRMVVVNGGIVGSNSSSGATTPVPVPALIS